MTTNEDTNLVEIVRSINVLLDLDTYQGMSDTEINMIIDYRVNEALTSEQQQLTMQEIRDDFAAQKDTYASIAAQSQAVLQSLCERLAPNLINVADVTEVKNNG